MADKTPTPEKPATIEDALRGPEQPEGFSGIRPFVMGYKPAIAVILLGGGLWYFTHPLTVHGSAQAGTIPGKVSGVAAGDIVAQPHAGATLKPLVRATLKPVSQVAQTDLTGTSGTGSAGATAAVTLAPGPPVQQNVSEPAQAPQTAAAPQYGAAPPIAAAAPATESPVQVAAAKREAADRTALEAPLPAPAPVSPDAANRVKEADSAPPSGTFLEPGHVVPITLQTSIDSTVGGPALVMGYVGGNVLDYYQRVVVIPRFSKTLGHLVGSQLQPGQDRIGAIWSTILLPNGHTISLTDSPGVDLTGTVGFSGKIDNHERGQLARVVAFSILAAGAQLAQPQNANNCGGSFGCSPSVGQSIAQGLGTQIQTLATTQYNRGAQTPPTLHVIEGAQVGLELTTFLPIAPYGSQ